MKTHDHLTHFIRPAQCKFDSHPKNNDSNLLKYFIINKYYYPTSKQ
jgi:hypothetical protein